ncbi:MAG: TonB-dependent receptor [Alphaproteobacteria bacterium]|nr:TonB-dependent receptor [Alphaproteobacteria bacterium]
MIEPALKRNKLWILAATAVCVPTAGAMAQQQLPDIYVEGQGGTPAAVSAPTTGRSAADGRLSTTAEPVTNPVDATSIVPADLQNYAGAASRVTEDELAEQRPLTNHEALVRVPGVVVVTDDGLARHGGIGIRGSNFRRSRKVLIMEDGQSINYSSYLDPSTHYTPPMERVENIEVVRGTVVSHGPLNNHGILNFQNLNPFGKSETVIKGALSYTEDSLQEVGNSRHVHTRQNLGNVGAVVSYSGADGAGAWDNERLRYNDVYGALGWRDSQQDLTISGNYFWQRDNYDEDNFLGTAAQFFANGRDKSGVEPDVETKFNTFNADYWRLQAAHNFRFTPDTTLSTRIYGSEQERNRFSSRSGGPEDGGFMRGRNRTYEIYGADSRIEFANLPLFGGVKHDVQAGVRYEHHKLTNCTAFGRLGEELRHGNEGNCRAREPRFPDEGEIDVFEADSFAGFLQTAIHMTPQFTVTPGVRFESYDVEGRSTFPAGGDSASSEHDHVLPGIAMAWEFMPRTTLYGGYHQGFAPHIVRDVELSTFPLQEEVGDNFQVGLRSTAMRGLTFDVAYFHSIIEDYQIKDSFTDDRGANIFGSLDEVQFNGIELAVRADSRPLTGGSWNLFGEANYTYTNSNIENGRDQLFEDFPFTDVSGNRVPFSIEHFASLTVGVAYERVWDISATYTYRGDFFSNTQNSVQLTCIDEEIGLNPGCTGGDLDELIGGKVDDVWLLSARSNFHVNDKLSLYLAGHNLTDELYVSDVSDGAKPGQGRTVLGGFTLKFD